jgi:hypothetical protein
MIERYESTAFTREQIERLQVVLRLPTFEQALAQAAYITGLILLMPPFLQPKGDKYLEKAKRRLGRISKLARELGNLLEDEPIAGFLVARDPFTDCSDRQVGDIRADRDEQCNVFIERLRQVEDRAFKLEVEQRTHRIELGLLPDPSDKRNAEVALIWPHIFKLWETLGHKVASTENGPLHSLINLVHEVMRMEEAAHRTFRDAVDRWNDASADKHTKPI